MKASFKKRVLAYFLDFILLWLFTTIVVMMIPSSDTLKHTQVQINELNEKYLANTITYEEYINEYIPLMKIYDKENILVNICNLLFILSYFVFYPFYYQGQTLGKKVLRIQIIKENGVLSIRDLIFRNFITTSLFFLMLASTCVFFLPDTIYFYFTTILGFIQILLVIMSAFMILYRQDRKGLHDLLLKTSVVDRIEG